MRVLTLMALVMVSCGAAVAQQAPIKMGLWEKTMNTSDGHGAPAVMKSKSCITPAYWQEMVGNATKQQPGCSIQTQKTAKGYSFNGTCTTSRTSVALSGSTTITDAEHIVSESHSTSTRNGEKHETEIHSTSRWLGADCGKIKPGDPEIED